MLERDLVLPHMIAKYARETPDRIAMKDVDGRVMTYRELDLAQRRWASALRAVGVEAGEHVVTMVPNSFESYLVWLGAAWLRAIEVPTNNMYLGEMLRYLITNSGARIAVISNRYLDRLVDIAGTLDGLEMVVVPDSDDLPECPIRLMSASEFFAGSADVSDEAGPEHYDICSLMYTSGTTGPSKGVLVPWAELFEFVRIQPADFVKPDGAYYTMFPAFHVSGKAALYVAARGHGHIVLRESFSLHEFWNDIRNHNVEAAGLVGPMAGLLMLAPPRDDDADNPLDRIYVGPIIPQIEQFMERFGITRIGTGFGMTEIGAPIASDGFALANYQSCGRPRTGPPYYEVRVVDEHDEVVPPGVVGELVVRAGDPWVLNAGYYGMPEATARAWRNGWFHTGDGFKYDEDGNYYFVDRLKDAIRRRGENVSSFEVESFVNQHPQIAESAAVAVPADIGEDDIKICVVVRPGETLDPAELIDFLTPRMPRFMIPRYVEVVSALPKTQGTLRTRKVELRESVLSGQTWDREAP
ncbi:MAG TPA: AMP-binding protein [Acidimicrobiales bacterium]